MSVLEEGGKQPTGIEKMVEKAKLMVKTRRVTRIDRSTYQVVGDHGVYVIVRGVDGNFHCGCQGYMTRGFCSHVLAVNLIEERAKTRKRLQGAAGGWREEPKTPKQPYESEMAEDLDITRGETG